MSTNGLFGPRTGHRPLFSDLCRFHQLDRKTRKLLRAVMERFRPERPALVFVDPAWLRRAMEHDDFAEFAETLRELHDAWFETKDFQLV